MLTFEIVCFSILLHSIIIMCINRCIFSIDSFGKFVKGVVLMYEHLKGICGSQSFEDSAADRCPVCGGKSQKVKNRTVSSLVKEKFQPLIENGDYLLCLSPNCNVVYFGPHIFYKDDLTVRVWFKETEHPRPVCYCKDVTEQDILRHIAEFKCCQNIRDIQEHTGANTGKECAVKNPTGR